MVRHHGKAVTMVTVKDCLSCFDWQTICLGAHGHCAQLRAAMRTDEGGKAMCHQQYWQQICPIFRPTEPKL